MIIYGSVSYPLTCEASRYKICSLCGQLINQPNPPHQLHSQPQLNHYPLFYHLKMSFSKLLLIVASVAVSVSALATPANVTVEARAEAATHTGDGTFYTRKSRV